MKLKISKVLLFGLLVLFAATTIGCEKENGAEKVGKKIDKAFKSVKDSVKKATE
jgi:predicted small secreted protein